MSDHDSPIAPAPSLVSDAFAASDAPVALVAGASRGLGLLVARELSRRGHRVAICARDAEELAHAERDLAAHGGPVAAAANGVRSYVCDVSDEAAVGRLVADVETDLGPIEVLVVVAGVIQVAPLTALSKDHFRESIDIMTWGPIHLSLAVLPGMRARGSGRIGIVSSIGGVVSPPHLLPYATAKFAATGFAEGLATALHGTGVSATAIIPGLMRTGSPERATFAGEPGKEFTWFSIAASLPLLSKDAEASAEQMVDDVLAGRATSLVGWMPKVATRLKGLAPALVIRTMGVANRLLPSKGSTDSTLREGRAVRAAHPSRLRDAVTTLGLRAASRFGERVGGPVTERGTATT